MWSGPKAECLSPSWCFSNILLERLWKQDTPELRPGRVGAVDYTCKCLLVLMAP